MEQNKALSNVEQNALSVSYDVLGSRVELDLDFVKRYLVRGGRQVSDQEAMLFLNTCKMQKLNPLVSGEAYLIKYSADDPAQIVVGKGAYMRRAICNPDYLYKEDGIIVQRGQEIFKKEGCCVYPGEALIGGWCRVCYNRAGKERQAYKEVALEEYSSGKANWKIKPATMINKVAISQCVREAFPKEYEGVYSEEEMIASGAVHVDSTGDVIVEANDEEIDELVTQEQRQALFRTAQAAFGRDEGNAVVKSIITEFGIENTQAIRNSIYGKVMTRLLEVCAAKNESEGRTDAE